MPMACCSTAGGPQWALTPLSVLSVWNAIQSHHPLLCTVCVTRPGTTAVPSARCWMSSGARLDDEDAAVVGGASRSKSLSSAISKQLNLWGKLHSASMLEARKARWAAVHDRGSLALQLQAPWTIGTGSAEDIMHASVALNVDTHSTL